jgi:DNA-binding response OmpR family regulator
MTSTRGKSARKVLIVDDDPSGAQLLETLLEFAGYEAVQPREWRDPIKDVERERPDLAIIDVRLRSRSGFDLLRQIREHPDPGVAGTLVLMMSVENWQPRSEQAGANGFIAKPFDIDALLRTIRESEEESPSQD